MRHKSECGANTARGCRENCGCWCHDEVEEKNERQRKNL